MPFFFKRKAPTITPGSRHVRAGEPHSAVWVVEYVVETVPGLPHARLVKEGGSGDHITVAAAVVSDPKYFLPAPQSLAAAAE